MLAYFSRQRIVGAMIVVLACALCITPIFSRGQGTRAAAGSTDVVTHVAHYPPQQPETVAPLAPAATPSDGVYAPPGYPLPRPGTIGPLAPPTPIVPQATPDHIVESKSFSLVSTKYRLSIGKAKALAQFLEEQIGRPEIFEISVEEPEAITIVASPAAQKTIAEVVGLMRTSPGKTRDTHPTASVPRG